jgi:phospholipid/cholesterol/gamma-HCH transport system substrate-binding protein
MKKKISHKVRLGIFVSLGIAVFIAAIYFIGEKQQLFRSTFRISGVFKDVGGLQAGNNVRLSGINVGTIDNVSIISDTSVNVVMVIDESTRRFIKKDAIASIGSEGLMGNKALIISPGTGDKKIIEDNDIIATTQPTDIDEILESLKTTIDNTSAITGDLAKISTNIESGKGTIGRLMMDKEWRQNFESTIINLKEGSDGFKMVMDKAGEIDSILIAVKSTIQYTANITADLATITNSLQSGEGTIGRLLMNTSAAENFDSTMFYLKESSAELKILLKMAQDSWLLGGF